MNALVVNCGSSSLKFQLINYDNRDVMAKAFASVSASTDVWFTNRRTGKKK